MSEKLARMEEIDLLASDMQEVCFDKYDIVRTMYRNSQHLDDLDVAEFLALQRRINKMLRSYRTKLNYKMRLYVNNSPDSSDQ